MKLNDIATYLLDNEQFHDYEFVYSENSNLDVTLRLDIDTKNKQITVITHTDFVFWYINIAPPVGYIFTYLYYMSIGV